MNDSSDTPLNNGDEPIIESPVIESPDEGNEIDEAARAEQAKQDARFHEGQVLRFVRVRFPGNNRSFAFLVGKYEYSYGQKVVAMSDRGMAVGFVNSFPYEVKFHKGLLPVRGIAKAATDEDILFRDLLLVDIDINI